MSAFFFLLATSVMTLHGYAWSFAIARKNISWLSHLTLALPLGAFANVLIVFMYTVARIALTPLSLGLGHIVGIGCAYSLSFAYGAQPARELLPVKVYHKKTPLQRMFMIVSAVMLASTLYYAAAHTLLLPTFQYDSATNWTMRSKLSFIDRHMAFDPTEIRGMAKPQYPFLFHALQIGANQGQADWSDTAANAVLFLLALSVMTALYALLRTMTDAVTAITATALTTSVPLFAYHLGQGYGDVVLVEFAMLACIMLALYMRMKAPAWLLYSALFASAAVWTKSEGLFFVLAPWALTVLIILWKTEKRMLIKTAVLSALLSLPWPAYLMITGMSFTPHKSSDLKFAVVWDGIKELPAAMFARGSFGALWFILPAATAYVLWLAKRDHPDIDKHYIPLFVWSAVVIVEVLAIYTLTPNATFLLNAQSFYRQMILPAILLILTLACMCGPLMRHRHQ